MERATGKDIVEEVLRNMRDNLEPMATVTLIPSLYQIYLHTEDFERLESVLSKLESEVITALDAEIERMNTPPTVALGRLARRLGVKLRGSSASPKFERMGDRWEIHFQEEPEGSLEPGTIEIVSELASAPTTEFGVGTKTVRVGQSQAERTVSVSKKAKPAVAQLRYEDERGPQTFSMVEDEIVIGRKVADASYWVDLPLSLQLKTSLDVSREHVRIRRDPVSGSFEIKDLSTLGTSIDGTPVVSSLDEADDGSVVDRDRWQPLPMTADIDLAGVINLQFEAMQD